MVTIERKLLFLKDKLIFFPSSLELEGLIKNLGKFELLRIKETEAILPENTPHLISKSDFRTSFIDLKKDLNKLWQEMDKSSCRYEINKAEKLKDRIKVTINQNPETFLKIYNDFVKRKRHISQMSEKRLNDYLKVSDFFLCYFDQNPMVGHLLLHDEKTGIVRLIFSATRRLENEFYKKLSGPLNRYLHWQEIQYYKTKGFSIFDTGGIGSGEGGVGKFKLSLGGYKVTRKNYIFGSGLVKKFYQLYLLIQRLKSKSY